METEQEVKPDESGKFSADYVHSLREENKARRLREKELEDKFKDVETKFTTLKTEVDSKTNEELEKQNKFKELYEKTNSELETWKTKAGEVDKLTEKLTAVETQRKNELLEQLTDEHKEFAKDLPLDKLPAFVKLHKDTKIGVDNGRSGGLPTITEDTDWESLSVEQKEKLKKENPQAYNKIYKKKFGFNPS